MSNEKSRETGETRTRASEEQFQYKNTQHKVIPPSPVSHLNLILLNRNSLTRIAFRSSELDTDLCSLSKRAWGWGDTTQLEEVCGYRLQELDTL